MRAEALRSETEKMQWMSEMRAQMTAEKATPKASVVETAETMETEVQPETLSLDLKEDDLVTSVKAICKEFSLTPEGQKAKVTFRPLVDELMVEYDHEQLKHALDILLGNSVRFSPGNCQITVNIGRSGKDKAVIQIADNGIGIRDEFKAKAFEPMLGSEGIGLDKVKDIVVAHGGTIRLEDNPGGGTIFIITLSTQPEIEIEEAVMMDDEE